MALLSPFVYWAQDENHLYMKVDLKDVKEPLIDVQEKKLHFQSKGIGAQGYKDYEFIIQFHSDLKHKIKNVKITDQKVDLRLTKAEKGWWPRVTSQPQKPAWLKIDFDRWQSEDDLIDEKVGDIREHYPELYKKLQKENLGYVKEEFKKVYLTLYNLFMFVGFLYVFSVLCIKFASKGTAFFPETYETVGSAIRFLILMHLLDIMHPLFGFVKGSAAMSFLQVAGRIIVVFFVVNGEPKIEKLPVIFCLFLTWSAVEIIRHPYYIVHLHKKEYGPLIWLRYSAWIILYPTGFILELVIMFNALVLVDSSQKWLISLPNALNFTFHFPTVLTMHVFLIMFPGMYALWTHMWKIRRLKLGGKSGISKLKKS